MTRLTLLTTSACDTDYAQWIAEQTELLRARDFEHLDINGVIEEFKDMGANLRHALTSRIETLLTHLLKCQFQPDHKSGSWMGTINEQRDRILDLLEESPSLNRLLPALRETCYIRVVRRTSSETGLPSAAFPKQNPYTIENLLDVEFIP